MKKVIRLFYVIVCLSISFYLMMIINEVTLDTNYQRFFVFAYFGTTLLALLQVLLLKFRSPISKDIYYKVTLISYIFGAIFIFILGRNLIPQNNLPNNIIITIDDNKNEYSQGYESRLIAIKVDNKNLNLKSIDISGSNWRYDESSDLFFGNREGNNTLNLKLPKAKSIELTFIKHAWSGIINIKNGTFTSQIDLYDKDGAKEKIVVPSKQRPLPVIINWLLYLGEYFFVVIIFKWVILWTINKKSQQLFLHL